MCNTDLIKYSSREYIRRYFHAYALIKTFDQTCTFRISLFILFIINRILMMSGGINFHSLPTFRNYQFVCSKVQRPHEWHLCKKITYIHQDTKSRRTALATLYATAYSSFTCCQSYFTTTVMLNWGQTFSGHCNSITL